MFLKNKMQALFLGAAMAVGASAASAVTIDFTNSQTGAAQGVSVSCTTTDVNSAFCRPAFNPDGVGVRTAVGSGDSPLIEGFEGTETLSLSFGTVREWSRIVFANWGANDSAILTTDTGSFTYTGGPVLDLGGAMSSALSISNTGAVGQFRVSSVDVAPVPLPAAGWMLLAGVGGMIALRRRQKA